jgi:hypothetical protein
VNPALPGSLSEIILRLLEKEPDHRYQSAEGLAHDLEQVRDAQARPRAAALRIGEHDVPLRLLPPRLVGCDPEVAALRAAFDETLAGRCQGVLVGGPPGVGKKALVDQLRQVVTGRDGWFVAGKFDQYRRDVEFDAGYQAFRALGRLLLAEPEGVLAEVRQRGPASDLSEEPVFEVRAGCAAPRCRPRGSSSRSASAIRAMIGPAASADGRSSESGDLQIRPKAVGRRSCCSGAGPAAAPRSRWIPRRCPARCRGAGCGTVQRTPLAICGT